MLDGKIVNLRIMEKDDIPLMAKWENDPSFVGEFFTPIQVSKSAIEKGFKEQSPGSATFIVEDKDSNPLGIIIHFKTKFGNYASTFEIGYMLESEARGKGYCSEAITIMLDYLFLTKDIQRIQALISDENIASKRVLQKNGFTKEGVIRKLIFTVGKWWDCSLYSILRDEWGSPKVIQ